MPLTINQVMSDISILSIITFHLHNVYNNNYTVLSIQYRNVKKLRKTIITLIAEIAIQHQLLVK
jgi:hypothetical protein